MKEEIKNLKKIELHLHLDGSISIPLASKLSGLSEKEVKDKIEAPAKCLNLKDYLKRFDFPIRLLKSRENLKIVAEDLAKRLAADNIIYAEVRFAPLLLSNENLSYEDIIDCVLEGVRKVSKIKIKLILCLMRGASYEENLKTIKVAYKYLTNGVGGIDLAGDERTYELNEYKELFKIATDLNIPFTIHAGEVMERDIKLAIDLGAKRIGHGVKSINDKKLIELIKSNNILLEICPTSNIQTNAFNKYHNHPVYTLYKEGVNMLINTDNMAVSKVNLSEEYQKLLTTFPFTISDFKKMNINALNYTFLSSKEKLELLEELMK